MWLVMVVNIFAEHKHDGPHFQLESLYLSLHTPVRPFTIREQRNPKHPHRHEDDACADMKNYRSMKKKERISIKT